MSRRVRISPFVVAVGVVAGLLSVPFAASPAAAATLPAGFQEQVVFSGLNQPSNIEFSPDGRIFVAEKRGSHQGVRQSRRHDATVFANLSSSVHDLHDRGLFGLALAPGFPANPWVYVLYTYDAPRRRGAVTRTTMRVQTPTMAPAWSQGGCLGCGRTAT